MFLMTKISDKWNLIKTSTSEESKAPKPLNKEEKGFNGDLICSSEPV
jgi:hypothetical protein